MDLQKFESMKEFVLQEGFFLSYSGYISEDILEAVGFTLRRRLEGINVSPQQIRQVFSIFVELVQNVIRYSETAMPKENQTGYGILSVTKDNGKIAVISGNFISKDEVPSIKARLDALSVSSPEELREVYKRKLKAPPEAHSKGAGLGLIEVMRRCKGAPEYTITEAQGGMAFFVLKAMA